MRSRTSCERREPLHTPSTPNHGCTPTPAAHTSGPLSIARPARPGTSMTTATSERENPMPDPSTHIHDEPIEFPDVLAEFGRRTPPNPYGDDIEDRDCEEWPDPDEDDLELRGRSAQAATIDYRATRQELSEAGYGDGYSVQDLDGMPEIDSEFAPPAVAEDPLDYLEATGCTLRDLLDVVERWDWNALPGFMRLASDLIDGLCERCPLIQP